MPDGPGSEVLFRQIASDWQTIGVTAQRVGLGEGAELELRDRLARYSSPRWFLNQLNCTLEIGICSQEADDLAREAITQSDTLTQQALLADAHSELVAAEVFIPLGFPLRWALVRGAVDGYESNPWGLHPLFPLSQIPT